MTNTPAGPATPADQTGTGHAPGANDGRAGHAEEASSNPYTSAPYNAAPYYPTPYGTTPNGTTTPYGHLPPPTDQPPGAGAAGQPSARGRRLVSIVAVAVIAAAVGGGVGGYVGHQTGSTGSSAASTLGQQAPATSDQPASAISTVAQKVLPSVVKLVGSEGEGSGVVLSADGLILTNAHVLDAAQSGGLTAAFQSGNTAPVQVVGRDTRADVAVVRAQGVSGLTPIQLGNSDSLQVGQQVVAIGSPLGLSGTVTSGIVSALNRPVVTAPEQRSSQLGGLGGLGGLGMTAPTQQAAPNTALSAIQTDAAINPGNSGGPLVDMQGRIVGLNSAIASLGSGGGGQSGSIGLGFSIPINQAKRIADELVANGHATQAQLGVSATDAAPDNGARLAGVQDGSAAAKAGLQPGDVITKVGDQLIENSSSLQAAINSQAPGSTVPLTVRSGAGAARTVSVTLGSVTAS